MNNKQCICWYTQNTMAVPEHSTLYDNIYEKVKKGNRNYNPGSVT